MKNIFYAICGLSLLLLSCQKEEAAAPADPARSIYLRAQVENTVATRAPYQLSEPNQTHPLKVAVWASTTQDVFKNLNKTGTGTDSEVALHTEANFTNGAEQLLNDAVYPTEGTFVYFVGLHPKDGWTTPAEGEMAGKTASGSFNGYEDVMFAPQISGKYGENVTDWPTFQFRHLLTWLRVSVVADGEAVSAAWGRLKSLKIKTKNRVTIDLGKTNKDNIDNPSCISFSDDAELDFYKTGSDVVFVDKNDDKTWFTLPDDNAVEVAYVLCAPVTATEQDPEDPGVRTTEYTLIVETEFRTVEVPVDLMSNDEASPYFTGNTRNRKFLLNLKFKMGSNIAVQANITDWAMGGTGSEELDPNKP